MSDLQVPNDLPEAQLARLRAIFGQPDTDFDDTLARLAAAALAEYALAFTGQRAPATMRELRELRLSLLYGFLPPGRPTDEQIGALFQLTPSQVGTLIAGARARFAAEMDARLRATAAAALRDATKVDEDTVRIRVPDSLARYLKDLVARTAAPPMDKRRDASQTYDLSRSTITALSGELGEDPAAVRALEWS
jgi:hypothetical protein